MYGYIFNLRLIFYTKHFKFFFLSQNVSVSTSYSAENKQIFSVEFGGRWNLGLPLTGSQWSMSRGNGRIKQVGWITNSWINRCWVYLLLICSSEFIPSTRALRSARSCEGILFLSWFISFIRAARSVAVSEVTLFLSSVSSSLRASHSAVSSTWARVSSDRARVSSSCASVTSDCTRSRLDLATASSSCSASMAHSSGVEALPVCRTNLR